MNPLISLIVPVFNGQRWIKHFFEQFEEQTYDNLELILVDDGSTDITPLLLDRYSVGRKNIIVFHTKNGGPSFARNFGLEKAKGDYIVFADVDDRFYPTYVEYLYKLIIKENADMSVCGYIKMTEAENYDKYLNDNSGKYHVLNKEEIIHSFSYRKYINGYCYLKLIRADIARQIRFPEDIVYGEDYIYIYEIVKKCQRVVCGEQILYIYIQYSDSSTHQKKDTTINYQKAWKKHIEILEDAKKYYKEGYDGILEKCYLLAINNTARIYDKKRDKSFLRELHQFIKRNAYAIFQNKEAGKHSRALVLLGMINVRLLTFSYSLFLIIQRKAGMTFRKTQ